MDVDADFKGLGVEVLLQKISHPFSASLSGTGRCLSECWITCSRRRSSPLSRAMSARGVLSTAMNTAFTTAWTPGDTLTSKSVMVSVSTLGMMTGSAKHPEGTAFVRLMSTPLRAFGHYSDRGYDLTAVFLKKTYPYTSASSNLFTTFALVGAPYCLLY